MKTKQNLKRTFKKGDTVNISIFTNSIIDRIGSKEVHIITEDNKKAIFTIELFNKYAK